MKWPALVLLLLLPAIARSEGPPAGDDWGDEAPSAPPAAPDDFGGELSPQLQARGRAAMEAFLAPNLDGFMEQLAPPNGPVRRQHVEALRDKLVSHEGLAHTILRERAGEMGGHPAVMVTLRSAQTGEAYNFMASFGPRGRILKFKVGLARHIEALSNYLDYLTHTRLRLPFDGHWHVIWGGRTIAQNYHAAYSNQRFAYDFNVVEDGSNHRGDVHQASSYFAFGKPILAPAPGLVVEAVDGVPDNIPPERNPKQPTGNHVVLDLGHGEYALLAHMKQGSVRVQVGDRVRTGQLLGLCGNSGNSTQPHLHFELMTSADFMHGVSIPAQFEDYVDDGQHVARGEPLRNQMIWMP